MTTDRMTFLKLKNLVRAGIASPAQAHRYEALLAEAEAKAVAQADLDAWNARQEVR